MADTRHAYIGSPAPATKGDGSATSQIIVLKVGTSSLVNPEKQRLNISGLARIVETVQALRSMGHHVIIVTSGAVGVGCHRLGLTTKPTQLAKKQALAAVGQVHLMKYYEDFLNTVGLTCAQVLVTLDNLADRGQYINVRNTFTELMAYGVVPVVNENDTVAVQELRFGDNDTLSAHVSALVRANFLFLMTDVDYLFTANPKNNPDAQPIYEVPDMVKLVADTSTQGTQWGTGGMATKLTAARIAVAAGTTMVICNSNAPELIEKVILGEQRIGTKFYPIQNAAKGRKRWILSVPVRGQVLLDAGAVRAVRDKHKSLFAPGIIKVVGEFHVQDAVQLCDEHGSEFARALFNFSSEELDKIVKGRLWRKDMAQPLGYATMEEVAHRGNITLLSSSAETDDAAEDEAPAAAVSRSLGRNKSDGELERQQGSEQTPGSAQPPQAAQASDPSNLQSSAHIPKTTQLPSQVPSPDQPGSSAMPASPALQTTSAAVGQNAMEGGTPPDAAVDSLSVSRATGGAS